MWSASSDHRDGETAVSTELRRPGANNRQNSGQRTKADVKYALRMLKMNAVTALQTGRPYLAEPLAAPAQQST
jgi:hypothetical protein